MAISYFQLYWKKKQIKFYKNDDNGKGKAYIVFRPFIIYRLTAGTLYHEKRTMIGRGFFLEKKENDAVTILQSQAKMGHRLF